MLLVFGPLAGVILALNLMVESLIKLPLIFMLADVGAHEGERPCGVGAGLAVALGHHPHGDTVRIGKRWFGAAHHWQQLGRPADQGVAPAGGVYCDGQAGAAPPALWKAIELLPLRGLPALQGELRSAAALSAAMPMLGAYSLLAGRHGHEGFSSAALLATTVTSFFSLSAILWLMRHSAGWRISWAATLCGRGDPQPHREGRTYFHLNKSHRG